MSGHEAAGRVETGPGAAAGGAGTGHVLVAVTAVADVRAPRAIGAVVARALAGRTRRGPSEVRLAVHEAVANAVLNGGGPVTVAATVDDRAVTVTVTDPGAAHAPGAPGAVGAPGVPGVPGALGAPGAAGPSPLARPPEERGRGEALIDANCDRARTATVDGRTRVSLGYELAPAR